MRSFASSLTRSQSNQNFSRLPAALENRRKISDELIQSNSTAELESNPKSDWSFVSASNWIVLFCCCIEIGWWWGISWAICRQVKASELIELEWRKRRPCGAKPFLPRSLSPSWIPYPHKIRAVSMRVRDIYEHQISSVFAAEIRIAICTCVILYSIQLIIPFRTYYIFPEKVISFLNPF